MKARKDSTFWHYMDREELERPPQACRGYFVSCIVFAMPKQASRDQEIFLFSRDLVPADISELCQVRSFRIPLMAYRSHQFLVSLLQLEVLNQDLSDQETLDFAMSSLAILGLVIPDLLIWGQVLLVAMIWDRVPLEAMIWDSILSARGL